MRHTPLTSLTYILLVLPALATTHFISACNDSSPSKNQQPLTTSENSPIIVTSQGTAAVSPEALFDFLHIATPFEFWNCISSDKVNRFFVLDSKDDETDEGFNPLLLLGLLREPQLPDEPRALSEVERKAEMKLHTTPVSFAVTGSDSISITQYADNDFTPSVDDTVEYLTDVLTGPGRVFSAKNQDNNTTINCTANNVSANIMF